MANLNPTLIPLAISGPSVLACGAWLKNSICLTQGNQAYISPVIGDLASAEARLRLNETVHQMCQDFAVQPEIVAHDLHPDFYSSHFAQNFAAQHTLPLLAVQHHHAHIAAICAEHQIEQPVLGLALDGIGFGTDHTAWGGELLWVNGARFQRLGHLIPLALPGGDRAAQEPWRMAASVLAQLNRYDEIVQRFGDQPAAATLTTMLSKSFNCPQTSSMGRLFDAVAGLLLVNLVQSHEAQAALLLQQLAEQHGPVASHADGYRITDNNVLDFLPLLSFFIDCRDSLHEVSYAAALFHATLIAGLAAWVEKAARQHQIGHLALGGGCFHNTLLRQGLIDQLSQRSITVLTAHLMPPDDSAIALGQAWVSLHNDCL